jgi:ABC-type sulfate/molybdate transport systems ATPase subunit
VRLAFSIATTIEPEILLVDEVLSAGDLSFQGKARQRMRAMMSRAKIIVIVSHDLGSLPALCDTGLWLDHGRVRALGPVREVVAAYKVHVQRGPTGPAQHLSEPASGPPAGDSPRANAEAQPATSAGRAPLEACTVP